MIKNKLILATWYEKKRAPVVALYTPKCHRDENDKNSSQTTEHFTAINTNNYPNTGSLTKRFRKPKRQRWASFVKNIFQSGVFVDVLSISHWYCDISLRWIPSQFGKCWLLQYSFEKNAILFSFTGLFKRPTPSIQQWSSTRPKKHNSILKVFPVINLYQAFKCRSPFNICSCILGWIKR